jgi:hypothetical protein
MLLGDGSANATDAIARFVRSDVDRETMLYLKRSVDHEQAT